jgi:hypothetical protein
MKRAGAMREARVSGNGRNLLAALAAVLPLACSAMAMAGEQAITVAGQQAYLNVPPGARAGVVLVSGSGGLHPQDLFMRTRHRFEAEGVATLMVSFQSKLGPAVQELRRHVPRVTLAGMSAGTVSVSRAIRNGARADGLVLVSGFLMPGSAPNGSGAGRRAGGAAADAGDPQSARGLQQDAGQRRRALHRLVGREGEGDLDRLGHGRRQYLRPHALSWLSRQRGPGGFEHRPFCRKPVTSGPAGAGEGESDSNLAHALAGCHLLRNRGSRAKSRPAALTRPEPHQTRKIRG